MTTYGNLNPQRGEELLIYVGTQIGNTVTFASAPTLFNKSVTFGSSTDLITDKLPNLDDLGAPSAVVSAIDSISHTLTGSGSVHKTDSKRWVEWRDSGATKIVRWGTAGSDGYSYEAPMVLSQYEVSGDMKQVVSASITLTPKSAPVYSNTAISAANSTVSA